MTKQAAERTRWTGKLNYTALREALEFLGVERQVNIRRANGTRRRGAHRYRNGEHCITVSTYLTVEEANRVLLHELTHAAQLERFGTDSEFNAAYTRENARRGYKANAFEVEARTASEFTDDFRIAR